MYKHPFSQPTWSCTHKPFTKGFLFHAKKNTFRSKLLHKQAFVPRTSCTKGLPCKQPFQENTDLLITRRFFCTNNRHCHLPRNWSCSLISQNHGNIATSLGHTTFSWLPSCFVAFLLLCCVVSLASYIFSIELCVLCYFSWMDSFLLTFWGCLASDNDVSCVLFCMSIKSLKQLTFFKETFYLQTCFTLQKEPIPPTPDLPCPTNRGLSTPLFRVKGQPSTKSCAKGGGCFLG